MTPGRLVLISLCLVLAAGAPALAAGQPAVAAPPAGAAETGSPLPDEGPLFTPAPKLMAPECHFCSSTYSTSPGGGAASHWGHGATCTDARNDVWAQLSAYVDGYCAGVGDFGRCAFQVVYTSDCYAQNNVVVVDAYATFRCWTNYCF